MSLQWENGTGTNFWSSDPECSQYRTRFVMRGSLPTRALVSFPGSGNTWTRYLVEAASGVFTGSVFNDRLIIKAGHHGEARPYSDGSTLLQKTHHNAITTYGLEWRQDHIRQFGGRGVLVIRNPYKAIVSLYNLKLTKSHTESVSAQSLLTKDFHSFVRENAEKWLEVIQDWLLYSTEVYVILYEVSITIISLPCIPRSLGCSGSKR